MSKENNSPKLAGGEEQVFGACFIAYVSDKDNTRSHLTGWTVRIEGWDNDWVGGFDDGMAGYLCARHVSGKFAVHVTASGPELGENVEAEPVAPGETGPDNTCVIEVGGDEVCVICLETAGDGKKLHFWTVNASKDIQAVEKLPDDFPARLTIPNSDPNALGACFFGEVSSEDHTRSHLTGWKVRLEGVDNDWLGVFNNETAGFLCARNVSGEFAVHVTASGPDLGENVEALPIPGARRYILVDADKIGVIGIKTRHGGKEVYYWTESNKDWV